MLKPVLLLPVLLKSQRVMKGRPTGAATVNDTGATELTQPVLLLRTLRLKLYVAAPLAGMVTLMGLLAGILRLLIALKFGIATGVPVTKLNWSGLPVVDV